MIKLMLSLLILHWKANNYRCTTNNNITDMSNVGWRVGYHGGWWCVVDYMCLSPIVSQLGSHQRPVLQFERGRVHQETTLQPPIFRAEGSFVFCTDIFVIGNVSLKINSGRKNNTQRSYMIKG